MGGYGIPYAAVIGAALIEIVRNALLLAGVDPYWQGTFVGLIIAGAMLLVIELGYYLLALLILGAQLGCLFCPT